MGNGRVWKAADSLVFFKTKLIKATDALTKNMQIPTISSGCCSQPPQTVSEMGAGVPGTGLVLMTNWWFPTTECVRCSSKPPCKTLDMKTFATTDQVFEAFYVAEMAAINKLESLLQHRVDAKAAQTVTVTKALIGDRYLGVQCVVPNQKVLKEIDNLLAELDKTPQSLLTNSKIRVECMDGMTEYSLTAMAIVFEK